MTNIRQRVDEIRENQKTTDPDDWDRVFEQFAVVLSSIPKGKPGDTGKVDCPRCNGVILYYRAHPNGHLRLKCETEGCISGIQ